MSDDWRVIPYTRGRYSISRGGAVLDGRTGELRPIRKDREGRANVDLATGSGTYGVARLLAMAFMSHPRAGYLHVHHRNGDPSDDRLENLEWVTPSEHKKRHQALRNQDDRAGWIEQREQQPHA